MKNKNTICCKDIRSRIGKFISSLISIDAAWIQNHIENCPKCQRRLASLGKVYLAMSLLKSRPHDLDLLKNANMQTIDSLAHSVRHIPKAEKLRNARPQLKFYELISPLKNSIGNTAACFAILFLLKTGIFHSMNKFQSDGEKAVHKYFEKNLGSDLSDEIFS
ncbi:MAG: hypothetical protein ABFD79_17545 [Phycisphaerales bacterium]